MKGIMGRLFTRQLRLAEATPADACALAALHAASFHRGWSENEFERLLSDRNVLAHRATAGENLDGFILSRLVLDEAWGGNCSRPICAGSPRSARAGFFSRSTRAMSRRFGFIAVRVFEKSGGEIRTMRWAGPPWRLSFAAVCCDR